MLRPGERMALPAARSLADEADYEPCGELDDGKAFGDRAARFWNDVQGLPAGNHSRNSIVRRAAPVYSGAGELDRREDRGSTHRESGAEKREVQLLDRADDSRVPGFDYCEVFAGLFDAAAAVFRVAGSGRRGHRFPAGVLPGLRKVLPAQGDHGGARPADVAGGSAVR